MVASFKIMPPDIAFLYQSTEKCGMDGGFSEKLPVMEKCGSLIFGRLQLKLNTLFSLFTMPETVLQMVLNTLEIVFLIPFKILDTVLLIALKPLLMPDFMVFTTFMTALLMPFHTEVTTLFTALKIVEVVAFMALDRKSVV